MQTTGDRNKENAASPNSASPTSAESSHQGGPAAGAATEIARHYGDHGRPATTSVGPAPQDAAGHQNEQTGSAAAGVAGTVRDAVNRATEQAGPAVAKIGETAQDLANRAREQAGPAMAKIGETAQDLASRAREQAGPVVQSVYDQGARAGEYMTRNVHEYPATALLIAAAVGYGVAYLLHGGSRREHRNPDGRRAHR